MIAEHERDAFKKQQHSNNSTKHTNYTSYQLFACSNIKQTLLVKTTQLEPLQGGSASCS